jgi:hypothetical protein
MRRLSIDPRRIAFAWLVPFEIDENKYGIAYRTKGGGDGSELIGTMAEAESVLQDLERQQDRPAPADIVRFPKDTAAS